MMAVQSQDARNTSGARSVEVEDRIDPTPETAARPQAKPTAFSPPPALEPPSLAQRLRLPLMVGVPLLALAVILFVWLTSGRYQSTDDAYVQSARVQVSSNIPGRVVGVEVRENQLVKQGDVLFRLDPQPLQTAVAQREAEAAQARLQVEAYRAAYGQKTAESAAAQDMVAYQKRELARQKTLLSAGVASQAQVDQAQNNYDAAVQKLAAAREAQAAALASLGGAPNRPASAHPAVQAAEAALSRDRLNRSYGVITAPQDGIVTKVDQLQVGNYINAAQPLFSLVSPKVWIEANLKEDQLARVRPGQPATVEIDARKGVVFHGKVVSLSPGTGSSFALLPAENATGNWVKVVQRLVVRVELDPKELADHPVQAGLSARVRIDTGKGAVAR